MARFTIGRAVRRKTPRVVVDAGLAPGRHRFALTVVNEQGRRSRRDVIVVAVLPLRGDQ